MTFVFCSFGWRPLAKIDTSQFHFCLKAIYGITGTKGIRVVSITYNLWVTVIFKRRWFTWMRKGNGPNIETWSTPKVTVSQFPWICCLLFVRGKFLFVSEGYFNTTIVETVLWYSTHTSKMFLVKWNGSYSLTSWTSRSRSLWHPVTSPQHPTPSEW